MLAEAVKFEAPFGEFGEKALDAEAAGQGKPDVHTPAPLLHN